MEKPIFAYLVMQYIAFFETERSLLCSQAPAIGSYLKPYETGRTGVFLLEDYFSIPLASPKPKYSKNRIIHFIRTLIKHSYAEACVFKHILSPKLGLQHIYEKIYTSKSKNKVHRILSLFLRTLLISSPYLRVVLP